MNISVLFFANLRERYQRDTMDLNVPEGTLVKDIFSIITDNTHEAQWMTKSTLCAVNANHVSKDTLLKEGDELALLPPMAGG